MEPVSPGRAASTLNIILGSCAHLKLRFLRLLSCILFNIFWNLTSYQIYFWISLRNNNTKLNNPKYSDTQLCKLKVCQNVVCLHLGLLFIELRKQLFKLLNFRKSFSLLFEHFSKS